MRNLAIRGVMMGASGGGADEPEYVTLPNVVPLVGVTPTYIHVYLPYTFKSNTSYGLDFAPFSANGGAYIGGYAKNYYPSGTDTYDGSYKTRMFCNSFSAANNRLFCDRGTARVLVNRQYSVPYLGVRTTWEYRSDDNSFYINDIVQGRLPSKPAMNQDYLLIGWDGRKISSTGSNMLFGGSNAIYEAGERMMVYHAWVTEGSSVIFDLWPHIKNGVACLRNSVDGELFYGVNGALTTELLTV